MESSWHFMINATSLLVDPWLVDSEIDGFKWLNEQWHVVEPVSMQALPEYNAIVISQSYEDHCHLETLRLLDPAKALLATSKAYHRLRRKFPNRTIRQVPHKGGMLDFQGVSLRAFRPQRLLDPIYFSMYFAEPSGKAIFYAPHGFALTPEQLEPCKKLDIDLLITTFTDFKLAEILGGHVNPGEENAAALYCQLEARRVVHTHDEEKQMKGPVAKYAQVQYPDYQELLSNKNYHFVHINDYRPVDLSA